MNSATFTKYIARLLVDMELKGERPIGVDWKRSTQEQARLYALGKSKCDGVKKVSAHQRGRALDILFQSEEGTKPAIVEPKHGYAYWHRRWKELGGKPAIAGDACHFEG